MKILTSLVFLASHAAALNFEDLLLGSNENPPVTASGSGQIGGYYDAGAQTLSLFVDHDLTNPVTAAHIHAAPVGSNGGVIRPLSTATGEQIVDMSGLNAGQLAAFEAGDTYVNLHTAQNGGGEVRAQLNPFVSDAHVLPKPTEFVLGTEAPDSFLHDVNNPTPTVQFFFSEARLAEAGIFPGANLAGFSYRLYPGQFSNGYPGATVTDFQVLLSSASSGVGSDMSGISTDAFSNLGNDVIFVKAGSADFPVGYFPMDGDVATKTPNSFPDTPMHFDTEFTYTGGILVLTFGSTGFPFPAQYELFHDLVEGSGASLMNAVISQRTLPPIRFYQASQPSSGGQDPHFHGFNNEAFDLIHDEHLEGKMLSLFCDRDMHAQAVLAFDEDDLLFIVRMHVIAYDVAFTYDMFEGLVIDSKYERGFDAKTNRTVITPNEHLKIAVESRKLVIKAGVNHLNIMINTSPEIEHDYLDFEIRSKIHTAHGLVGRTLGNKISDQQFARYEKFVRPETEDTMFNSECPR